MMKKQLSKFFEIIKYPIITDKSTQLMENNQYSFAVDSKTDKHTIKKAIEHIFDVQVYSVNTMHIPPKKRKVRNIIGHKTRYKKAIIKLADRDTINLLPR